MTSPKPKRAPTEREQFEAAYAQRYTVVPEWMRRHGRGYWEAHMQYMWQGWQLARRRGKGKG